MAKFNVGDKAKIKVVMGHSADNHLVGQHGRIIEDDPSYTHRYKLRLDSGDSIDLNAFSDEELELVEEARETVKFKVGDEVTVVKASERYKSSKIGTKGKIDEVRRNNMYSIDTEDLFYWNGEDLELTKETMTYEEALKRAIDGTKVCIVDHSVAGSYAFFDKDKGKFMWHSGIFDNDSEIHGCQPQQWKVWVKPELPKPLPKFQPKQFVVNSMGDIGIITEHTGYSRNNIPEYNVRFNVTTGKVKPVLETELSEVVL
jgi:hypothetical protein